MGTRADFYVGRGVEAEWLGSIAWDGYPDGVTTSILTAETEDEYRLEVAKFSQTRDDWTTPANGWPWPWDDSNTTDYAYAFDGDHVWASGFGCDWFDPLNDEEPNESGPQAFPNMRDRRNMPLGSNRSGAIILTAGGDR